MKIKHLGRAMCICTLAVAASVFSTGVFAGCNNGHAEAEITIEYDGVSYVLEYTMYRNMYPQTVQHFIELADNGFYNNTIIHDYQTSNWYGGGYNYVAGVSAEDDEAEDESSYSWAYANDSLLEYLERNSKEKDYFNLADPAKGIITPSVYGDLREGKLADPYRTLIGEFTQNNHKIENGALKNSYGALKFYYVSKSAEDTSYKKVYLDKYGSALGVMGEYRYNSATSLFSIQTGTSTSTDSTHCIFATLDNADTLRSLRTAVTKSYDYEDVNVYVDNYDEILGANKSQATYRITKKPIIVKSVKITKY